MKALLYCAANKFSFLTPGYREAKSLQTVNGKPFVFHQVQALLSHGAEGVIIALPKGNKEVPNLFANEPRVSYLYVEDNLGTAGAIALLPQEDILFVPGDLMTSIDVARFAAYHEEKGSMLTLYCHPESNPEQKNVMVVRPNGQGFIILPKETSAARDFYYRNIIPTELCILSADFLETLDPEDPMPMDITDEIIEPSLAVEMLFVYQSPEYAKRWTSTPSLKEIEKDLEKNLPETKNLQNKQKAIFVDRDGTITEFGDFVVKADMLKLIPGVGEAINAFHDAGYLVIGITNQPVIARGETDTAEMENIHANLTMQLGKEGAYLDDIYYCPHYPKAFPESNLEYTLDCDCRKPKTGLVKKAVEKYGIDLSMSWFIGDTTRDVQTGINAGTKTALVLGGDPNYAKRYGDAKADIIAQNIIEAAPQILAFGKAN